VGVAADTAVEAVVMVEAAEVSTEVAWAAEVHVSRAEALEVDMAAVTVATAMVEATAMADMAMTVTDSPEVF